MRLTPHAEGFALAVKVVPGASRRRIVGMYGDGIKVTVTAAPEDSAANEAVLSLLAETLEISRAGVRLLRGQTSPRKEVLIAGITAEQIEVRLTGAS